jgi:hypothetical protein
MHGKSVICIKRLALMIRYNSQNQIKKDKHTKNDSTQEVKELTEDSSINTVSEESTSHPTESVSHSGKLIVDATVADVYIKYPLV